MKLINISDTMSSFLSEVTLAMFLPADLTSEVSPRGRTGRKEEKNRPRVGLVLLALDISIPLSGAVKLRRCCWEEGSGRGDHA